MDLQLLEPVFIVKGLIDWDLFDKCLLFRDQWIFNFCNNVYFSGIESLGTLKPIFNNVYCLGINGLVTLEPIFQ